MFILIIKYPGDAVVDVNKMMVGLLLIINLLNSILVNLLKNEKYFLFIKCKYAWCKENNDKLVRKYKKLNIHL